MKQADLDVRGKSLFSWFRRALRWWAEPRATNRDDAFRERVIRSTTGILILLLTLSLVSSILLFDDPWTLISFQTLHVFAIVGVSVCALAAFRGRLVIAGWFLVITTLGSAGGFVLLARLEASIVGILVAIPAFMMVGVVATLVLPTRYIIPLSIMSAIVYGFTQFGLAVGDFAIEGLIASQQIPSVLLLLLIEGALLRQLRVEFDGRLAAMRDSIYQMELAKQQAEFDRQRAEDADRAKSQFLANMSHELRTPLNAIIGYDEAMLAGMAGEFTDQQTKILGYIQHNSRRLLTLINDILDLSKIESGSMEIYLAPMSPRNVIENSVAGVRSLADEKGLYLDVAISDAVPEVIMSDAKKLEQIIVNLLSNAIKFTSEGGVSVDVDISGPDRWRMCVSDTGIGIPADSLSEIFEPFYQVDGTPTRKYKGTGLGLAITKRLVEALDGNISVRAEVSRGSAFFVDLPRVKAPPVPDGRANGAVVHS